MLGETEAEELKKDAAAAVVGVDVEDGRFTPFVFVRDSRGNFVHVEDSRRSSLSPPARNGSSPERAPFARLVPTSYIPTPPPPPSASNDERRAAYTCFRRVLLRLFMRENTTLQPLRLARARSSSYFKQIAKDKVVFLQNKNINNNNINNSNKHHVRAFAPLFPSSSSPPSKELLFLECARPSFTEAVFYTRFMKEWDGGFLLSSSSSSPSSSSQSSSSSGLHKHMTHALHVDELLVPVRYL